jgi:hypothetical protein
MNSLAMMALHFWDYLIADSARTPWRSRAAATSAVVISQESGSTPRDTSLVATWAG